MQFGTCDVYTALVGTPSSSLAHFDTLASYLVNFVIFSTFVTFGTPVTFDTVMLASNSV